MKLDTYALGDELKKRGFDFYSGVPCSFLSNLINYAINEADFIMSTNEGDAVATCAGAYMSGKKSVVLIQNSGLANAVSPLTSLNYSFKIPVLGFVSLRGEPGIQDEPQHELMGVITENILDLVQVEWEYLSNDIEKVKAQLDRADKAVSNNKSFFLVVKKNTLDEVVLKNGKHNQRVNDQTITKSIEDELPFRQNVLETLNKGKGKNTVLLATTGKTGRELFEIEDSENNFYMIGSMGCISSIGLGLSLNSKKLIAAIDGDGALLMRMGNLATNGYYGPENLLHILIDNNVHDSTGGQFTVSHNVDFVDVAKNCKYTKSKYAHSLNELEEYFIEWQKNPELTFIYIKAGRSNIKNTGRPSVKPFEVKDRLMKFIRN